MVAGGDARETALFLSIFNSVPYDNLLRTKFYGANLTKGLLMQSFVLDRRSLIPFEDELVEMVCKFTHTSQSVSKFSEQAGFADRPIITEMERLEMLARIDAIMFSLFGFDKISAESIFETFPIWRAKQVELFGSFVSRDLALEAMDAV